MTMDWESWDVGSWRQPANVSWRSPTEPSWFEEDDDVNNNNVVRRRGKKRSMTPIYDQYDWDVEEEEDSLCHELTKKCYFEAGLQNLVNLGEQIGKEEKVMVNILQYLSDDTLRVCAPLSKLIQKTGQQIIRRRNADHPFLLWWLSEKTDASDRVGRLDLNKFVQTLEDEDSSPCQAVMFLGTMEVQDSLEAAPILNNRITGVFGFSKKIIMTTPNVKSSVEINETFSCLEYDRISPYFKFGDACQALCIPKSERLVVNQLCVPVYSDNDEVFVNNILENFKAACSPPGYTLKGVIMMCYQGSDTLLKHIVEEQINSLVPNSPVAIAGGNLDNMLSSAAAHTPLLACGWAICGNEDVRVASVALEVTNIPQREILYANIQSHFADAKDGFIIIFYNEKSLETSLVLQALKSTLRPGIPIVGIMTETEDLIFQGHVFAEEKQPTYLSYANKNQLALDALKMVCVLVAY